MGLLKRLRMRFASTPSYMRFLPSGDINYAREVGDGRNASVVAPALYWMARTFPEAPLQVRKMDSSGQLDPIVRHPMAQLIRRPNEAFSGRVLWMATVVDFYVTGNGYWLKVRDRYREVVELWWVPSWMITPKWPADGSEFISHYEYRPGGVEAVKVPVDDVVHFRFGLDPDNMRVGLSPLASVLREVYTDDEAARFTAAILKNMGVPGLVVSPDQQGRITRENAEQAKEKFKTLFSGQGRGEPVVMTSATKVEQFGFSPDQLNLRDLRRIPEERVSAVLGVPAVVAGLGAGLDRSTFTNMAEARDMAYESNIIPAQSVFAEELDIQLLPDFEAHPEQFESTFDLTQVRVLQSDRTAQTQRAVANLVGGAATLGETRRELGLPVTPEHEVFYRPVNVTAVPADDILQPPAAPLPQPPGVGDETNTGPKVDVDLPVDVKQIAKSIADAVHGVNGNGVEPTPVSEKG